MFSLVHVFLNLDLLFVRYFFDDVLLGDFGASGAVCRKLRIGDLVLTLILVRLINQVPLAVGLVLAFCFFGVFIFFFFAVFFFIVLLDLLPFFVLADFLKLLSLDEFFRDLFFFELLRGHIGSSLWPIWV